MVCSPGKHQQTSPAAQRSVHAEQDSLLPGSATQNQATTRQQLAEPGDRRRSRRSMSQDRSAFPRQNMQSIEHMHPCLACPMHWLLCAHDRPGKPRTPCISSVLQHCSRHGVKLPLLHKHCPLVVLTWHRNPLCQMAEILPIHSICHRADERLRDRHNPRDRPHSHAQDTYDRPRHANERPASKRYEQPYRRQPVQNWSDHNDRCYS